MKTQILRKKYLDYFIALGHKLSASDLVVPQNDPSVLFTPAGMNPFKDHFLGRAKIDHPQQRATSCQKCVRTGDIDNVGVTPRHLTFFEMLGNFSFGDYFKKDAIHWAWRFVTKELGIPEKDLWVSVYETDDEAFAIWRDEIGLPPSKIARFGEDDNFWPASAPTKGPDGPCGPDSEIFVCLNKDFKPTGNHEKDFANFIEIWNLVFTQFNRQGLKPDGTPNLIPLPRKNIDTGMGLERVAAVLQGKTTVFDTDALKPIVDAAADICGVQYPAADADTNASLRKIADHLRAATFAITDHCPPSNTGAGYVIRKLLRRAVLNARKLGGPAKDEALLERIIPVVVEQMSDVYPDLRASMDATRQIIAVEEEQFRKTLSSAGKRFETAIVGLKEAKTTVINGETSFDFYETYGLPLDVQEDIARESGMVVDVKGHTSILERSRDGNREKKEVFAGGAMGDLKRELADQPPVFVGYEKLNIKDAKIIALLKDGARVETLCAGETGLAIINPSPFYGEKGGQVGDTGTLEAGDARALVTDTTTDGVLSPLKVTVKDGCLTTGAVCLASVDLDRRAAIQRHHTATHLLQAALKRAAGDAVRQKGSYVAPDRLRFDYQATAGLTPEQIRAVEKDVNAQVCANAPVIIRELPIDDAKKLGAMALFGEKYGEIVRVVSAGDAIEFCGGCHVSKTGDIGAFRIVSDSSIAAGVRRIEALAGLAAIDAMRSDADIVSTLAVSLKAKPDELIERIETLSAARLGLEKDVEKLKTELAVSAAAGLLLGAEDIGGGTMLVVKQIPDADGGTLKAMAESLVAKMTDGAVVLASAKDGKAGVVVAGTKSIVKRGFKAGNVIKELAAMVGGGGGGRPDFAQAGGKSPEKIPELIEKAKGVVLKTLVG